MNLNCESEKDPATMVIRGYNLRFQQNLFDFQVVHGAVLLASIVSGGEQRQP
jgi:hypothetical protein